jgi:(1->4)-alpha-D-glucan 1-alpha-D-glucosylmutase
LRRARQRSCAVYALFEALQEYMHREQPGIGGWQEWPEPFRDPRSSAVTEFAEAHVSRVQFFEYLPVAGR